MEVARKYNIFQTIIVFQDAIKSGASSNPLKFQLSQCYARCNLVQLIKFANEKLIQFPSFVKGTNCEWVFRSCKKSCYLLTQNNLNWKHKYVAALDFYIIRVKLSFVVPQKLFLVGMHSKFQKLFFITNVVTTANSINFNTSIHTVFVSIQLRNWYLQSKSTYNTVS